MSRDAKKPDTIFDLVYASLNLPALGKGHTATVYPIADPAMDEYVFRIGHSYRGYVDHHTCLSAVDHQVGKRNFGASRLAARSLEVNQRQGGTALKKLWSQLRHNYLLSHKASVIEGGTHAYETILQMLADQPLSAYIALLDDMNFLTSRGKAIDPYVQGDNVMLAATSIGWVDVDMQPDCPPVHNHLAVVKDLMLHFVNSGDVDFKNNRIQALTGIVNGKLDEAAKLTCTPRNKEEAAARVPSGKLAFARTNPIQDIPLIRLSQSPDVLREKLREVEDHLGKER